MKKELSTGFDTRQYMQNDHFELFYYRDINPSHVSTHAHTHYEYYFFLEGEVDYELEDVSYSMEPGDFLMIPPGIPHRPVFRNPGTVYRRFVLWLSPAFYERICSLDGQFSYGFDYIKKERKYHFRSDFIEFHSIQGLLLELLEESRSSRAFKDLNAGLRAASFLVQMNRLIHDRIHQVPVIYSNVLYLNICDYINNHLNEDLSLEKLSAFFYVSKYHISHIFKENMGLPLHQYILKKRLYACRSAILSGTALTEVYQHCGFNDYSGFYRAFKKEFGLSPSEFRDQHELTEDRPPLLL